MKSYTTLAIMLVFIILGVVYAILNINYNNTYSRLEESAKARQDVSKITFDKTWKILAGQAEVAEKERESFKETFLELMNARVSNDENLIMKWGVEAQIPITADLYKQLSQSISSQRAEFLTAQKELIDIKREADTLRKVAPASFFLAGRKTIEISIVTSTKTEETFSEGKEDDIKLLD